MASQKRGESWKKKRRIRQKASQKRGESWKKKRRIRQNGLECRRHPPKTRGAWIHEKHRTSWALKSQTKGPLTSRLNLLSTLWQNTMIKVSLGWNLLKLSLIHQEGKFLETETKTKTTTTTTTKNFQSNNTHRRLSCLWFLNGSGSSEADQ